jgi:hypothetical protein
VITRWDEWREYSLPKWTLWVDGRMVPAADHKLDRTMPVDHAHHVVANDYRWTGRNVWIESTDRDADWVPAVHRIGAYMAVSRAMVEQAREPVLNLVQDQLWWRVEDIALRAGLVADRRTADVEVRESPVDPGSLTVSMRVMAREE